MVDLPLPEAQPATSTPNALPVAQPDRDYRHLDRQRRLALLTIFCVLALSCSFILTVVWFVHLLISVGLAFSLQFIPLIVLIAGACLSGTALWLARLGHPIVSGVFLMGAVLGPIFILHIWLMHTLVIDSSQLALLLMLFVLYPLAIVFAGIVGDRRFLFGTATISSLLLVIACLSLPARNAFPIPRPLILSLMLLWQALTLGAMTLFVGGYLQALQRLDDTRVRYEQAVQIDSLKEQFITSVNHELRNPIMAMLGYLELLQLPRNQSAPDRLNAIVAEANRAGQDLRALLNNILETRRMDQGIENFTPRIVHVIDALDAGLRLIDPREAKLAGRKLQIKVARYTVIWGDPVYLQQILTNLISNAIKYSPPDTPIEIAAGQVVDVRQKQQRWGRKENVVRDMVEIVVRDYGLGIPPSQAPLLFHRFARLPRDLSSKVVGNGLGLYLCRALAEVMDGTIRLESSGIPGTGTTFYVRLPVPPADIQPPIEQSRLPADKTAS